MHDLNRRLSLVVSLAALALAGCPNRVAPLDVHIIKPATPDPLEGVTHLRFRVLDADGRAVLERVEDAAAGSATLDDIPSGQALRLQIAGFRDAPPDGTLVSWGMSSVFTVPEDLEASPGPTRVDVFLRQVERFSPVISPEDPETPVTLSEARAGHTATLLDDGRVLITGGFEGSKGDPLTWSYKSSIEIFDPAKGTVSTDSPPMSFRGNLTLRAFHTATRLQSNQVLIVGGESATPPDKNPADGIATTASAILFDPEVDDGRGGWAPMSLKKPRTRHTAVLDRNGKVLLVGGIDWVDGSNALFVDKFEWFDPDVTRFNLQQDTAVFTRIGHAALPVLNGQYIAIGGGIVRPVDAAGKELPPRFAGADDKEKDGVKFFQYVGDKMQALAGYNFAIGRSYPAAAAIGDGKLLMIGGFKGLDAAKPWNLFPPDPYSGSEIVRLKPTVTTEPGPPIGAARGHVCAVTLQDGRVLAIGGRGGTTPDALDSTDTTTVFTEVGDKVTADGGDPLAEPRFFHTCTLLADGSVLVTGGVRQRGSSFATVSSMEIYVPRPSGE